MKDNSHSAKIVFDDEARRSFLTGFHKRKVARREEAKKRAQLREKQQRLDTRREHRRELAERAARNAAEVEKAYGMKAVSEDVLSSGPEAVEEAYEGEEQLATVTVVQDVDLSTLLHPPRERRTEHRKQRARRTERAERAGRKRK